MYAIMFCLHVSPNTTHHSGPITVQFHDEPLLAQNLGRPMKDGMHYLVSLLHDESFVAQALRQPINNKAEESMSSCLCLHVSPNTNPHSGPITVQCHDEPLVA